MTINAFISALSESSASRLLPVVIAVVWVIFITCLQRRRRRTPAEVVGSRADGDQTDNKKHIRRAARRIRLNLGRMRLPSAQGRGQNPMTVSGRDNVVDYETFDPEHHKRRHIHPLRSLINPRGVDQVSIQHESHEENVLVITDLCQVEFAGSPNDIDLVSAARAVTETFVQSALDDGYQVGLVHSRERMPSYYRPGWPVDEIQRAIRRFQAGQVPDQPQALARLVRQNSQNVKAFIVISDFQRPEIQRLVQQLPAGAARIAIQLTGEWDHQLGGLPELVVADIGDRLWHPRRSKAQADYDHEANRIQDGIDQPMTRAGVIHRVVRRDRLDLPGLTADKLAA